MSEKGEKAQEIYVGHVKWFDTGKGYGFIVSPTEKRDILLHANVLRNYGQNSVADGSRIRILAVETERGIQAQEVLEIEPPEPEDGECGLRSLPFEECVGGELEPARVKWFDRAKGFGFANVFGLSDDVFIHAEVLRRSALADLQPGEAVAIRVGVGARGRLATQVSVWESAISETRIAEEYETGWDTSEAAE